MDKSEYGINNKYISFYVYEWNIKNVNVLKLWWRLIKDIFKNVDLLCPLCRNKLFENLDIDFNDLYDDSEEVRFKCGNCGRIYTKSQLIDQNRGVIDENIEDLKDEALKQMEKEITKMFKKWK